jgi:hypothetical protein
MATIIVGYGAGDLTESERFQIDDGDPFDVKVSDRTGVLQVETPGKVHLYAPTFWKYVDVDTDRDVTDE